MLKVMQDKVLIKFVEIEEKTASGLYIPQSAKTEMETRVVIGEVIDINTKEKVGFKIGDTVVFKMFVADEVEEDGTKYGILEIQDILAVKQK